VLAVQAETSDPPCVWSVWAAICDSPGMRLAVHMAPGRRVCYHEAMTTTQRFIGRCKTCKTVQAVEAEDPNLWRYGRTCCGRTPQLLAIEGTKSEKKCGALCRNAMGPRCDCSCEGENHGRSHFG